ncbi:MAG: hypothetical protein FJZ98_01155 [Chloroflexi bacterium]|nr:hypothetical protein [Chloroflexota bacterium]
MSRNNRLVIISTIVWIVILVMLFFSRIPTEDLIAQAVEATLQAHPTDAAATLEVSLIESSPITASTLIPVETAIAATQEPQIPCLYAKMVMETIPDGTQISKGGVFTKTWVLENSGSCAWTPGFRLVFTGGEPMNGPSAVRISRTVAPGERVTVSVDLSAPYYTGSCRGNWVLESNQGVRFAPIWLQIDVVS